MSLQFQYQLKFQKHQIYCMLENDNLIINNYIEFIIIIINIIQYSLFILFIIYLFIFFIIIH